MTIMTFVLYIVSITAMSRFFSLGMLPAFSAASYLLLIISILLRTAGLLADQVVMIFIALSAISLFLLVFKRGDGSG